MLVSKTEETRKWPGRPYNVKVSIIMPGTNDFRLELPAASPNSSAGEHASRLKAMKFIFENSADALLDGKSDSR